MVSSYMDPASRPPFLMDSYNLALKDLDELGDLPRLPLDQAVPLSVLSRRRHAISSGSGDSPYSSRPRMKRRGAISYDQRDASAMYIRYLGELSLSLSPSFTLCIMTHSPFDLLFPLSVIS